MDGRILVYILITFARGSEGVNGTCPADNFQCHNNKCIPSWRLCNGHDNCWDRSDEILCDPCPANFSRCTAGRRPCVPHKYVCDGKSHCYDRSDESTCDTCKAGAFHCDKSRCILSSKLCDGSPDCGDNTDEANCDTCKAEEFHCDKSRCIKSYRLCDGSPDCDDNSDETSCDPCPANYSVQCPSGDFRPCVHDRYVCDAKNHCSDGSDESTCDTCKAEAFHCDRSRCIKSYLLCDGSPDCDDNSDETNCDMATDKYGVLKIREPVFKNKDVELSFQLSAGFSPTEFGPIFWYRYRDGTHEPMWESKRVSFSELNATYRMLIKQADDDDQGSYNVFLPAVLHFSLYVKLTLQELPKNVQFTSPNKSFPGCRNCSYAEIGHGLEVECSVTDESEEEETVVIQIHSLNAQKATYNASRQSRGRYVARISDIREQNHLANVTCEVSTPSLPHPLTATSKLYVLRRPAKPILTIGVLKEGNSSKISCLSGNSRPPSKLYYKLGENTITVNQTDESYIGTGSSLSYRSVATLTSLERVWNNQMITCCLQHETLSHPLCSDRVKIVYEFPPSAVNLSFTNVLTGTKQYNTITCVVVNANPACGAIIKVNDADISNVNVSHEADESGGMTTIVMAQLKLKREDDGKRLFCTANCSMFATNQTDSFIFKFRDGRPAKPILTIGVLKEGNSSNISCLSDNSLPPSKLYYKLGENTITVNQTEESYIGSGSSLSYRSVATLTSLERVWNNQMITCCLQHETLSYPLCSDRVKIVYEFPPSAVHLSYTNVLTGTKQYNTITCVVVNANPACGAIIKVKDADISNVNVSHEADKSGGMTTIVMAQLNLKREDDGKRLFCTANCSMFATNQTDSFIFKFRDDSLATSRHQNLVIVAPVAAAMVLLVAIIAVMLVCVKRNHARQEITQQEQAVLYHQLNREEMEHSSLFNELELPVYANET